MGYALKAFSKKEDELRQTFFGAKLRLNRIKRMHSLKRCKKIFCVRNPRKGLNRLSERGNENERFFTNEKVP